LEFWDWLELELFCCEFEDFCDFESELCLASCIERCICCIIFCTIDCVSEAFLKAECDAESEWESEDEAEAEEETFFETPTEIEPSGEVVVVVPESCVEVCLPSDDELSDEVEKLVVPVAVLPFFAFVLPLLATGSALVLFLAVVPCACAPTQHRANETVMANICIFTQNLLDRPIQGK